MKVYVVESGTYSDRTVTAVCSSLERAQRGSTDWKFSKAGGQRQWYQDASGQNEPTSITEFEVDED